MSTLPTTTACYQPRIAELQARIQALLEHMRLGCCTPLEVERIGREMRPLYAAIWAMHSEISL